MTAVVVIGLLIEIDAEDRVLAHRRLGFRVHHAERFEIRDLAVADDHQHGARNGALCDVVAQPLRNAPEPVRGKSGILRLGDVLRGRAGKQRPRKRQGNEKGFPEYAHFAPPEFSAAWAARRRAPTLALTALRDDADPDN